MFSGRGAVRLACLHGVQEVEGSNPFAPTEKTPGEIQGFLIPGPGEEFRKLLFSFILTIRLAGRSRT